MLTTQPSLFPAIDETMMPAMPQTKVTAHVQRKILMLVMVS
jgi:hypothetical protein